MKRQGLLLTAVITGALTLMACSTGGTTPPPANDTTPPTIVSISPANGATGVAKDANIVVTFSEKMDQASAQAAFQSADLGAVTFSWNADSTVMTVNPNTDLVYTASGKSYSFSVTTTAKDAANNALASTSSNSFTTYKQITATLPLKGSTRGEVTNSLEVYGESSTTSDIWVGDRPDNTNRRGFLGFDLSSLPAGLIADNIISAQARINVEAIVGSPFSDLFQSCSGYFCFLSGKSVVVEHVYYGDTVTSDAYDKAPLVNEARGLTDASPCTAVLCLFVGTVQGMNSVDMTSWVKDDWTNKASRNSLSELRFRFPKGTDADNAADRVELTSASTGANKPTLLVTYLIP